MPSNAANSETHEAKSEASNTATSAVGTKKQASKKASAARNSKSPRRTVATLTADLKSLESRLKGADTKNRNALKSLEAVVAELQSATQSSNSTQKAALTRGLNALEARMEAYLTRASEQARAGVRQELAAVTAPNASIETLNHAVQSAHVRLNEMDVSQRESLVRLNRHIAGIALSVEKRLIGEAKARKASAAALDTKIDSVRKTLNIRVDQVETETADALKVVGDRISEFASVLEQRSHASDADTAERLADLAQETHADFNHVQTEMTARLEALETIAANWSPVEAVFPANMEDPRVDEMVGLVGSLQDELGRMHARLALLQDQQQLAPTSSVDHAYTPSNVVPMAAPQPATSYYADNPYADAARALEASIAEATSAGASTAQGKPSKSRKDKDAAAPSSHVPQEFDPASFLASHPAASHPAYEGVQDGPPNQPPSLEMPPNLGAPISTPMAPPVAPTPPVAPPMASVGAHSVQSQVIEPVMPAPMPVSTYADPAYAESDDMRAERIGGENRRKPSLPKLPITGRNLRVGALAAGIAVVGLIAGKTLLGGTEGPNLQVGNDSPSQNISPQMDQNPQLVNQNDLMANAGLTADGQTLETQAFGAPSPPIGQYAEMRTPNIQPGSQDTLDGAVAAGNPIAQFQKGLVQLQAGQMEDGARLIRLSANRNQPAAQYRLAKLYESGTGVAKDIVTARELVERAAIGGNRIAMHDLGNYYAYGQGGLERDMSQALEWFSKAAERGVVDSQFNVAFLREGNEGVAADTETALFWYYIAARQGDQGAPERISVLSAQMDAATQADIKSRADRFVPKPIDEAANGVFRDVPWAKAAKTAALDPARSAQILKIREAQTLLSDLGYPIGRPDGAAGPKTRAAIKQFEAVNGLPETGAVTDELLQRLEIAAGA
jgi:localization factor PodJL